jgi:hypothetical protein
MGGQKEVSGPVRPLAVREEGKPSFLIFDLILILLPMVLEWF